MHLVGDMEQTGVLDNLSGRKIILASGSPRRRELLSQLGLDFEVKSAGDVDETFAPDTPADEVAGMLARRKGQCYRQRCMKPDEVGITADTVVVVDGKVFGKPVDATDAVRMLRTLSGRVHSVVTGVNIEWAGGSMCRSAHTSVEFAELTDAEIAYYVERYRPMDKAGAYGIQEWIGCIGVKHISGSYYNVMGLPLHLLYTMLRQVR